MSIKFLTDSGCDMTPIECAELGVTCIPIQITFDGNTYEDGATITHDEFYKKLEGSENLPTTSQINPATYNDYFEKLTADGSDVIVITLSSELSGTYQNAFMAAEEFPNVYVVDSLNATSGQFILLKLGLKLAAKGYSAAEIVEILQEEKKKIRVCALIDTLEYLKKGGRISATVAFAGGVLNIKPAIEVINGKIEMAGTARGIVKGQQLVKQLIENYGGIDWDKPVSFIYSGNNEMLKKFIDATDEMWVNRKNIPMRSLGGTIGTHIGAGAYGFAFFEK